MSGGVWRDHLPPLLEKAADHWLNRRQNPVTSKAWLSKVRTRWSRTGRG